MSQVYDQETGEMSAVTVLEIGPCTVVGIRTSERNGYDAVQLGFGEVKQAKEAKASGEDKAEKPARRKRKGPLNGPKRGHFKAAACEPKRYLRELRLANGDEAQALTVGSEINVGDVFSEVQLVDVRGVSKGKGFAGVMKRWNFSGGRGSHGSNFHRKPGSIGQSASPSRVFPGVKMPGRMGGQRVLSRNLRVLEVDANHNMMVVRGSVPGAAGEVIFVRKAG